MDNLLFYIFLAVISLPTIAQLLWVMLRVCQKTRLPIGVTTTITFPLGIILSFVVMLVSMQLFAPQNSIGPYCTIGSISFLIWGLFITVIFQPIIALTGYVLHRILTPSFLAKTK